MEGSSEGGDRCGPIVPAFLHHGFDGARYRPVSYIAPAREVSILIGAVMGSRLLAEGDARRRLPAAAAIVAGVIALAVG